MKLSFFFAFTFFIGFSCPGSLNASDDVGFDPFAPTELIYRSELHTSTNSMYEIFLSDSGFSIKKTIPVFNFTEEDCREIRNIIAENSSTFRFLDIRSLDSLQGLVRLVSSSKDVMFVLATPTQKLFVKVVNEKKVISSFSTNYWRFWALQSPIPSGFWWTPNGLDIKYTTVNKALNKKVTILSTDRSVPCELFEVLRAVLEPQKKSYRGSILVGVGIVACLVAFTRLSSSSVK